MVNPPKKHILQNISLQYPTWYLLLCLALGLLFALGLYYKDRSFREQSQKMNPILGFLRFLSGTLISFLLLSPLIKSIETRTEKPTIVIAQDASESIGLSMTDEQKQAYQQQLKALKASFADKYHVKTYSFGERVRDSLDFSFGDKVTNISDVLQTIFDDYSHQNLGAIILATDGIYNEGSSPNYLTSKLAVPVYSIALGDTTVAKDLFIRQVLNNKIAYLGDRMEVQVDISAKNFKNKSTKLTTYIVENNHLRKLKEDVIQIPKKDFFKTVSVVLPMDKSGVQQFRFKLSPLQGEVTTANNVRDIYIEVLDARQKILILAEAPHPDLSAMKQSLAANKNYDVTVRHIKGFTESVAKYDLVILHQLPSVSHAALNVLRTIKERHIPHLFVVGSKSNLTNINKVQDLIQIQATGQKPNLVQANFNDNFSLFTIDDKVKQVLPDFNPMTAPFGTFTTMPNAQILLYQRIGNIKTKYPLWALGESDGAKEGIIAAEGLWNWRLFDFMQHQNHEVFDELMMKSIQYLSVKEDKRRFRVNISKNLFKENEPILLNAELYNENYELINEPDVNLVITDDSGKEYPFAFNRQGNSYRLNAGFLPAGRYRFKGKTVFSGKELDAKGRFTIQQIQLEKYATTADHNVLQLISNEFGGQVVYPNNIQSLADIIKNKNSVKSIMYQSTRNKPLINLRWILGLLIVLLAVEWFFRKYFGGY